METELSFGQTTFFLWVPPFLSYELWKLRIELWKLPIQTAPKQLSSQFVDVTYSHVRRQGNCAAHNTARHARHVSKYTMWMEVVPLHLSAVISADLASFE